VYVPYGQKEQIPMIHCNLLASLELPEDMAEWPHDPKFVLQFDSAESVTVHLLPPTNYFSHIALPGAPADGKVGADTISNPREYTRRTPKGKMRGTNVRPFDIYLLAIGTWNLAVV
jgi:hypothetical protein